MEKIVEKIQQLLPEIYQGLWDKNGCAYFAHPYNVMLKLPIDANEDTKIAALLHDVYEDTNFNPETLGISENALAMIKLLTHKKGETYDAYIDRIIASGNRDAIMVKYCDVYHNLQPMRLFALDAETREKLLRKYVQNIGKLLVALR